MTVAYGYQGGPNMLLDLAVLLGVLVGVFGLGWLARVVYENRGAPMGDSDGETWENDTTR